MSKHAFWQALVFSIIVFAMGLLLGFFLDLYRADKLEGNLINSELNLADEQLRIKTLDNFDIECDLAVDSLFNFADKIFWEALKLEEYDSASKIGDQFLILHRRYDLLRTMLWLESIELKKKCPGSFNTVVYLYEYNLDDTEVKSVQLFYSRLLLDLKYKYSSEIILIPIAVNMNLESLDLIIRDRNLTEFPMILINEKEIITGVPTIEEVEEKIFS